MGVRTRAGDAPRVFLDRERGELAREGERARSVERRRSRVGRDGRMVWEEEKGRYDCVFSLNKILTVIWIYVIGLRFIRATR